MGEIRVGELLVDPEELTEINTSELVRLCRMAGHPAHRGIDRKVLISLLRGKRRHIRNKVDEYRSTITQFLKAHWEAVQSQVEMKCHGDCFDHTDFQVVTCWKVNKETLERNYGASKEKDSDEEDGWRK